MYQNFCFNSCEQLELQLQSNCRQLNSNNVGIQCSVDQYDQTIQTDGDSQFTDEHALKSETNKLISKNIILQDEIDNLNFQLSTYKIQSATIDNVR